MFKVGAIAFLLTTSLFANVSSLTLKPALIKISLAKPNENDYADFAEKIILATLTDGFQAKDLIQITKRAENMLSANYHLSLDETREGVCAIIAKIIDERFSSSLPFYFFDPLIEAFLGPFVNVMVTEGNDASGAAENTGRPTIEEMRQFVNKLIEENGIRVEIFAIPKFINAITSYASSYSELCFEDKVDCAKEMYNYFLDKTDTAHFPDFLVDPILWQLGNSMIEEILLCGEVCP